MDTDRLNRWLALGANIGVLIGIILLVVELDQNRDMMRAQTQTEITAMNVAHSDVVAADAELADILRRARFGQELTPSDGVRYLYHASGTLEIWQHMYYQYEIGLFDQEEFAAQTRGFEMLATGSAGFRRIWCQFRPSSSEGFRGYLDEVYTELNCDEIDTGIGQ